MGDDVAALRELIREANSRRPLRPGEEDQLLREAARGDQDSQDRLVAVYLPTVVRLANERSQEGLSIPDLVQEGSIGLIQAMREFPGSLDTDFAAFAASRVAAQLSVAIEAEAASVHDAKLLVAAAEDYDRTEIVLRHELHREPAEHELAEKLEWTLDRTRYVAQVVAEARKRHDDELRSFIDPDAVDLDGEADLDADGNPLDN